MRLRLAAKFGCSIAELGERVPSSEWPYWIALYESEPWGHDWESEQTARICHTVATMSGKSLKNPVKISDYLSKR